MARSFGKFCHDKRGTVTMMFAIAAVPMMVFVGAGLDYVRASSAEATLQNAADSAALAAGASSLKTDTDLQNLIQHYVDVNTRKSSSLKVTSVSRSTNANGDIIITVKANLGTVIMRLVGIKSFNLATRTRVSKSGGGKAEIVLVLDTTGSMAGSKIATLKTAANDLIADTIKANEGQAEPLVKIGIVPFAQYVNIGVSRRNKSWISVSDDYQTSVTTCTGKGKKQKCTTTYTDHKFYGCVGSRDYPYNVRDEAFSSQPVPGIMDVTCSNEVTDMTTNQTVLTSAIDALAASGNTYIGAGLTWGWRMVSPDAPFTQGVTYGDMAKTSTSKYVILMTDGENTRAPSYPAHDSFSNSLANNLTTTICTNIKASNIKVFTVAFGVTDATTLNMLKSCATDKSYAYNAQDNAALTIAFSTISKKLSKLRLAE